MPNRFYYWLSALLFCIAACKSGGIEQKYTLNPPLPEVVQQSFLTQLEAATPSDIAIPITLPLVALSDIVNAQVPLTLQDIQQQELRSTYPKVVAERLLITRESPISVSVDEDNDLLWHFDIKIAGNAIISLGLLSPSYPIDIRSEITLKSNIHIAPNWQLELHTIPTASVTKPLSLSVMGYEIPFKDKTENLLQSQLDIFAPKIDAEISRQIDLENQIKTLWKSLQLPFKVAEEPVPIWTMIQPTDIAYAPLQAMGKEAIQTHLKVKVRMATALGKEPPASTATKIPAPQLYQPIASASNLFSINMPLVMPVDSIEPLVRPQLIGKKFDVTANQYVIVEDIDLIGAGDRIIVKANVTGNAINGNIILVGIPQLDVATQTFSFDKFDYTLETGNLLKDKAVWLINKMFVRSVAQKMQFSAVKVLAVAQQQLQQQLNSLHLPKSQLKAQVNSLKAMGSRLENNIFRIDVKAEGTAALRITP